MERRLNCLIVDDNKVARVLLHQLLEKIGNIEIIGECENALVAKTFIENNDIDILFLDIEMPEINGLELLRMLPQRPLTILTTAKPGYAVEAFELNVVDYIVKPFSLSRIMLSIERAVELLNNKNVQIGNNVSAGFLFVRENRVIRKLDVNSILWMEAKGDYVKIYIPEKSYVVHGSLKTIEDKFNTQNLIRIHRSYIIALNKIDYIEDRVVYIHGRAIPISESYKEGLLNSLRLL